MEKILRFIEKLVPEKIYKSIQPFYHYSMALVGAILYRFPANKLFIIGVTGTKGKSTVTEMVNSILEDAGHKTALSNTIRFKINKESRPNMFKMSMPGRFFLQKFLRSAVDAGCEYAIIEMTSEGSKFFRNKFIPHDAFIFTNISPEHIESHGSFNKYLEAKISVAKNSKTARQINTLYNSEKNTFAVINTDDKYGAKFLEIPFSKKTSFSLVDAYPIDLSTGIKMNFNKNKIQSGLDGEFNVYNILAAASLCELIGVSKEHIIRGIEKLKEIPGRVQKIKASNFDIVIDYAHTAESLEALYKAFPEKNKICVLGNTGGGRDKWKRPVMAKVAEKYCSEIILTNEDPYDEDPLTIITEMKKAIKKNNVSIILDRRAAIGEAIKKATENDVVLITGKGTDPYIMGSNGKKEPWNDFEIASLELSAIQKQTDK